MPHLEMTDKSEDRRSAASSLEACNACWEDADDTQFLIADTIDNLNNLIIKTEETIRKIKLYFIANGLLLNPKKTQCIFIGNRTLLSLIPPETFLNCDGVHMSRT